MKMKMITGYLLHKCRIHKHKLFEINKNISLKRWTYLDRKWRRIQKTKYVSAKMFYDFLAYEGVKKK